jgi:hypothetical protein
MRFTASPVHDIHLSAPTTIVNQYHQQKQDVQKAVELGFHIAYLPGFCFVFHLGSKYLDNLVSASSPSLKMLQLAKKVLFEASPFGNFQSGHWSPLAIKYKDVILKEDGKTMNGAMEKVIDGLIAYWSGFRRRKMIRRSSTMLESRQECNSVLTIGRI